MSSINSSKGSDFIPEDLLNENLMESSSEELEEVEEDILIDSEEERAEKARQEELQRIYEEE